MAFPGTYNISYYSGDTFEFRIYPKDSSGAAYDLSTFNSVSFVISESRGAGAIKYNGYAEIVSDSANNISYVKCAILPGQGQALDSSKTYVYDVEVNKDATLTEYEYNYTLLTGTITITEDVAGEV
jgi:hypothetical protein